MDVSAGIAVQQAMIQQAIAMAVIKQNAQADRQIANILMQAVESVPAASHRGVNVNLRA